MIQAQNSSKISPKTAKGAENFYDGHSNKFFAVLPKSPHPTISWLILAPHPNSYTSFNGLGKSSILI
jgi:hypothetical protein